MPTTIAMMMLRIASSRVIGIRSTIVPPTPMPLRRERPKSPVTAWPSHDAYCTGNGWSSAYLVRMAASVAGSRLSPARRRAGSPGSARVPANTTTLASRTTISAAPTRRRTNVRMALRPRAEPGLLEPQEAVAVELEAGDVLAGPREVLVVVEVDQRAVVQDHLCRLLVDLRALGRVELRAALLEHLVEGGVRVAGVVLRAGRADELLDVAVGVD